MPSEKNTTLANESLTNLGPSSDLQNLESVGFKLRSTEWCDYISHTMEVMWRKNSETSASFAWWVTPNHMNAARVLHGGATMTLLDHCMGGVCYLFNGNYAHTLQLSTQFVKPLRASRWLFCNAEIVSNNKHNLLVEAVAWSQGTSKVIHPDMGNIIARAHGTFNNRS